MPRKIAQWLTVLLGVLTVAGALAQSQLFESDSKQLGNSKMDIVVKGSARGFGLNTWMEEGRRCCGAEGRQINNLKSRISYLRSQGSGVQP